MCFLNKVHSKILSEMKLLLKVNSEKRRINQRNRSPQPPIRERITHNRHTAAATSIQTVSTSTKILLAFILIVLIIIGFIAYLELRHNNRDDTKREILFGNNYDTGTFSQFQT